MSSSEEGGNAMYAAVDTSKKKNNRGPSMEKETEEVPAENRAVYSVVDKKRKKENSGNRNETPMEPMGHAIAKSNEPVAAVAAGGYNRGDNKRMLPMPVKWSTCSYSSCVWSSGAIVLCCVEFGHC